MPRLLRNLFFLGFLVVTTIGAVIFATTYNTSRYMAAASDKHRLLYSSKPPRIILVGGSNLAFSVDSKKIEKRFGMPVINMGLHAGLGLKFMLSEVQPALGDGDVVVIFPEYEHFYSLPLNGRSGELGAAIKFCRECISALGNSDQYLIAASGILQMTEGDILSAVDSSEKVYTRQGFDQRGDMVAHLQQSDHGNLSNQIVPIRIISPNPAIDYLNMFYRFQDRDNIRFFVIFPAIPMEEYKTQEEKFIALYDLLHAELKIPILGMPQDFIYPKMLFYDTVYHMTRVGRNKHTQDIIEALISALQR